MSPCTRVNDSYYYTFFAYLEGCSPASKENKGKFWTVKIIYFSSALIEMNVVDGIVRIGCTVISKISPPLKYTPTPFSIKMLQRVLSISFKEAALCKRN